MIFQKAFKYELQKLVSEKFQNQIKPIFIGVCHVLEHICQVSPKFQKSTKKKNKIGLARPATYSPFTATLGPWPPLAAAMPASLLHQLLGGHLSPCPPRELPACWLTACHRAYSPTATAASKLAHAMHIPTLCTSIDPCPGWNLFQDAYYIDIAKEKKRSGTYMREWEER